MNGKTIILGVAMSLIVSTYVYAASCHGSQEQRGPKMAQAQKGSMMEHLDEKASTAVEVGNKICPVTGEKVGMMGPVVQYEYQGKIYNFCCPMCIDTFKKDPGKYSKIAEENAVD